MDPEVQNATDELRAFLFDRVYRNPVVKGESDKAKNLLCSLYEYFLRNIDKMPGTYVNMIEQDGKERCVCDFISGMTDRYAIDTYRELMIPHVWRK